MKEPEIPSNQSEPDSDKEKAIRVFGVICWVIMLAALFAGCTFTPVKPHGIAASLDGNHRDSGVIAKLPDGSWIISEQARLRYDSLAALYGNQFMPPCRPGDGYTKTASLDDRPAWRMDSEHMRKFATMTRWIMEHRAVQAPSAHPP